MWLIDTRTLKLTYFPVCPEASYAILSHTWDVDELDFDTFQTQRASKLKGYWKVDQCCRQARKECINFAWVDTCCIDRRSSTELSEAINSMYQWYLSAKVCYVYMSDVGQAPSETRYNSAGSLWGPEQNRIFISSRWFTRGWTLQELLAPAIVQFFDHEWKWLGTKSDLSTQIQRASHVSAIVITGKKSIYECSIAQRMSWAARRVTSRPEDRAYSLLGIFNVRMPLLYGEGARAFLRLQETIIQTNDDETIFAWTGVSNRGSGLLAPSPSHFAHSSDIFSWTVGEPRLPYAMTNRGLSMECRLLPHSMNTYIVLLHCGRPCPSPLLPRRNHQIALYIVKNFSDGRCCRVRIDNVDLASATAKHWQLWDAKTEVLYFSHEPRSKLVPYGGHPIFHFKWDLQVQDGLPDQMRKCSDILIDDSRDPNNTIHTTVKETKHSLQKSKRQIVCRLWPEAGCAMLSTKANRNQLKVSSKANCPLSKPMQDSFTSHRTIVATFHNPHETRYGVGFRCSPARSHPVYAIKVGFDMDFNPLCYLLLDDGSEQIHSLRLLSFWDLTKSDCKRRRSRWKISDIEFLDRSADADYGPPQIKQSGPFWIIKGNPSSGFDVSFSVSRIRHKYQKARIRVFFRPHCHSLNPDGLHWAVGLQESIYKSDGLRQRARVLWRIIRGLFELITFFIVQGTLGRWVLICYAALFRPLYCLHYQCSELPTLHWIVHEFCSSTRWVGALCRTYLPLALAFAACIAIAGMLTHEIYFGEVLEQSVSEIERSN